ncbi:MAG: peptide deformylase [Dehalococcoidia bacterium]
MSHPEIVIYPSDVLTKETSLVERFDAELVELSQNLIRVMIEAPGIGVAANQIGIPIAVAVIGIPSSDNPLILVNPKVVKKSTPEEVDQEGCLSIPGYWGRPLRSERIRIKFQDIYGRQQNLSADGYLAQVIQHEVDHLNGLVYSQRFPDGETLQRLAGEQKQFETD